MVFVFYLDHIKILCFVLQATEKCLCKYDAFFFFFFWTFFNFGGCVFPVSPGAPGDQEPDSHQCSTPAETSQDLILATVINSNAWWPSVLEGRIPQLLRSLNLTSDHIWDTKECDGTQCVRKAKWNVTVHIICGGGLCGSTEKIISDFNPLCSAGENPLFVFFGSCFYWISAEKATLLAQGPDYYKWLLYPCRLLVENEEQKQIFKALFRAFSSGQFSSDGVFLPVSRRMDHSSIKVPRSHVWRRHGYSRPPDLFVFVREARVCCPRIQERQIGQMVLSGLSLLIDFIWICPSIN